MYYLMFDCLTKDGKMYIMLEEAQNQEMYWVFVQCV